ncbi:MAG: hypothetical protein D6744_01115 [Planctomycetota bacterium]|nr:MAG: hypothetical protein D6744_01115 [Planctomycetota bacterium]
MTRSAGWRGNMQFLLISLITLGAIGLFLALPGKGALLGRAGLVLLAGAAVAALVLVGSLFGPTGQRPWFVVLAALALFAAARVITHSRPVYSALYFIIVMISTAGMLILMQAEFLAGALAIVYGGAILVTYMFVIMLAQQGPEPARYDLEARDPAIGVLAGFVLLAVITSRLTSAQPPAASGETAAVGTVETVGTVLLTEYAVAIQVAGVLLLAAMVGALAIARRRVLAHGESEGPQC